MATETHFKMPVDSDHKATEFWLFSFAKPHMRAFHLSWFSFFCCFVSTFAAPPLLPLIRDNLGLTATDIGNAGIASVSGAVFARLAMGTACDLVGPRLASATLTLVTTPAVYYTSVIRSANGFLLARFFTGFSLASFVSASPTASRRLGQPRRRCHAAHHAARLRPHPQDRQHEFRRVAHRILHPGLHADGVGDPPARARPGHAGWELPEAAEGRGQAQGQLRKSVLPRRNQLPGWITALTYGYCFGVELTIDNIIAQYFYDRFSVNLRTAGIMPPASASPTSFRGLEGVCSPTGSPTGSGCGGGCGGVVMQTLGGIFCILLGKMGTLSSAIVVMILFSLFVQAACGLTFGVVPFISRRSLGLISGMTGGGGNVGAVVTQVIFFKGSKYLTEDGITYMGIMILCCTLPIILIHFPQWGSMLLPPKSGATAEDYYLAEWSEHERAKNYHISSIRFADNSVREGGRSQRGGSSHSKHTVPVDASQSRV
uniref:Major facilitator superfamily (MFS) profile domain-containing protein n=1 Tax=Ananas comosus var. bracteatus TaxID=296719 RepID=A0A6V7PW46_ANACO|nr:unnamed protein product [Ananas comosus var. bracteatus]